MSRKQEILVLSLSTVALGLIVGLSSLFVSLLLTGVEHLFLNFEETITHPYSADISGLHRLISVLVGGLIAALIWWWLRTKREPTISIKSGIDGNKMPVMSTAVHVMTQIFYVGTGGSVGRELAPREAGAMLAQVWTRFLHHFHQVKLPEDDRRLIVAAAAGAGFAGVYSAPITGMLFCIEILLKKVSRKTVMVSLTMSVIAMLVCEIVKAFKPYYLVGSLKYSPTFLWLVIVIAPVCGALGGLFRKGFEWAGRHQAKGRQILWQLPLAALVTGIVAIDFPQIMGNGRALAQMAISSRSTTLVVGLLFGAVAKALVTILTLRAGASGGTLAPSIAIGASIGAIMGFAFSLFVPGISIWQCAVLGGCTLLASSQQAPLMALFMMIEVSHLDYSAILPLGLGVCLAVGAAKVCFKN